MPGSQFWGCWSALLFSHNFGMAASAQGVSANAQIGVLIGIVVVFLIGLGVIAHNLGMHRKERIGIGS